MDNYVSDSVIINVNDLIPYLFRSSLQDVGSYHIQVSSNSSS